MATGTVTWTYDEGTDGLAQHCNVKKVIMTWTATAGGAAADTSRKIVGKLIKAIIVPGSPTPTNAYSITITDSYSNNVLAKSKATLASNGTSTAETYFFITDTSGTPVTQSFNPVVCDQLTITIASAGNAAQGQVILYYATM